MTLQEIKERIAVYESKWGKLGHTNIMKPENEIQHSELNERRNTMIKTTNDFYKFRQKVAIGKEANKLAHKATISPEELNERNFQNQIENNTLIHAGKKGDKLENAKYYAREGEPGNYRYYYTKEEYDAAHNHKPTGAKEVAAKEAEERQAYENSRKAIKNIAETAITKEGYPEGGGWYDSPINKVKSTIKNINTDLNLVKENPEMGVWKLVGETGNPVGDLMRKMKRAVEKGKLRIDKNNNMTGDPDTIAEIQKMSEEAEKYGKALSNNSDSNKVWNEFQKQTGDVVNGLKTAGTVADEAKKIMDEGGTGEDIVQLLAATDEFKKMSQIYYKMIGNGELRWNDDRSGFNKLQGQNSEQERAVEQYAELIDLYANTIEEFLEDDYKDIRERDLQTALYDILENDIKEHSYTKYQANSNGKDQYGANNKKFSNGKNINAEVKHSSITDLRQEREESIMSEYRAFKARANKGAEKNRLSHSAVISAKELNAKYEEELMKEYIAIHPENDDFESLSHSGQNFKYYAKVDLGNGNSRYFYTKEEYDAYNQPKKTTTTLVADKKPHNGGSLEATKKYHQEKAKEAKEAPYKNAAKTAGKELNMERALDKAWDKFEDSIDDKVESRIKAMEDLADKYDVNHPFAKKFDDKLDEIKDNWNKKINDEADKLEEKYGREDIWQNEEAQKFVKDVYSKGFKELEDALNAELDKQEASYKALVDAGKAWQKFGIAWDEIKGLSKYDKQVLAEEMGLDSFDEEDILNKYYIVEDDEAWREAHANDEDYGKAEFEKEAQGLTNFWNDYKAAKKSLGHSAFDDEDDENSLSHNSNGYGGTYLHKLDDFYGPGKPRYFYSEADWNAYQEGLRRNSYNADKEAEARQAKTDKQKADLARRSGMENYTKYQENKKADEEADARQAKIDEQKTRAKQKAGMEGYEEWNEKRQAEKEANAKKVAEDRNDMSGYAAWKKRRDYINNQKKASEAAEAKEAEKHEIEKKAVKNSVEVTKNKAAAKAQEEAEAAKRKEEERAANAKKDAASKEAAMKAGQKATAELIAENAARDKEHEKDIETRKLNEKYERLDNNIKNILKNTSDKYDKQIEGLNNQLKSMDSTSPEAKEIQRKISDTNIAKDTALDKELSTIIEDLGELYQNLDDKNGAEAQKLKAAAEKLVKDNLNLGPVTANAINNLQKTVLPEFFTHLKTGARKF